MNILRYIAVNVCFFIACLSMYILGWLDQLFVGTNLYGTIILTTYFVVGTFVCFYKHYKFYLYQFTNKEYCRVWAESAYHFADDLVFMGFMGTVVGFVMALGGIVGADSSNLTNAISLVGTFMSGIALALYTTLLGGFYSFWHNHNLRVLTNMRNEHYEQE